MADMITHLHPRCTCTHKPGLPCDCSCPVHGTNDGPGMYVWTDSGWQRGTAPRPGQPRVIEAGGPRE